jgi:RNA polymerase sigma-70 factor (ECF subfamily)
MDRKGTAVPIRGTAFSRDDEDAVYVIRCLAGNADAFEVIVQRHQEKMLNMAYRITSDYQNALDAVQEAFFTAYKNLSQFRGESLFSTWLARIVINHSKNMARKSGRLRRHECSSIDAPIATEKGPITVEHSSPRPSPLDSLVKSELDQKIQDCISALDSDFRAVLVLRDIEEYAYDEIGSMLGMPDGTVRSRLYRARASLKECLKKYLGALK